MFEIEIHGTYYEMGIQYGRILRQGGVEPEPILKQMKHRYDFADVCEKEVQKHSPEILEYLKGLAEGGNYDYNRIKLLPLVLNYGWESPPSCTICYVSSEDTKNQQPLMFRNYDWDYKSESVFTCLKKNPLNGLKNYSFSDIWGGSYGGFNEAGLVVGITGGMSYGDKWRPGVAMNLIVMWILDHCRTTDEAVQYIDSVSHMGAFHYFIVDQNLNIARILATPKEIGIERFKDQSCIQTNHFIIEKMKKYENPGQIPPSSPIRYSNVQKWLMNMQKKINLENIKQFCVTPHSEGGIHEDSEYNGIKFGTIWSWIYDFESKSCLISQGNPKFNSYKELKFEKKI